MGRPRPSFLMAAYLLDSLLGDPPVYPHPVRLMGRLIRFLEGKLAPMESGGRRAANRGCLLAVAVVSLVWLGTRVLISLPSGKALEVFLLYTCLARKDLKRNALCVAEAVERGDLVEARRRLGALAGRDTEFLDGEGICRAAVESTAENLVDAVLAPLFWAAWGGAEGAMAFKAVSTLDSMVGYRDERYKSLGRCSARLDDAAVFLPARLSIPLVAAAARLCGLEGKRALRVGIRDRLHHESPNSAHAQAAFAGALGIRLGGPSLYGGRVRELPFIGDGDVAAGPCHVRRAVKLLDMSSMLGLILSLLTVAGMNVGGYRRRLVRR